MNVLPNCGAHALPKSEFRRFDSHEQQVQVPIPPHLQVSSRVAWWGSCLRFLAGSATAPKARASSSPGQYWCGPASASRPAPSRKGARDEGFNRLQELNKNDASKEPRPPTRNAWRSRLFPFNRFTRHLFTIDMFSSIITR
jgi:hypothetical protein